MPEHRNGAETALREEIARLSRKEIRSPIDPTKRATTQHRHDIAALKCQVAQLERRVAQLSRKTLTTLPALSSDATAKPVRVSAKAVRSQRNRLGLSAADFGKLLGVSAQSTYNWERELARPRAEQIAKLAALRGIGKRVVAERLVKFSTVKAATGRKPK